MKTILILCAVCLWQALSMAEVLTLVPMGGAMVHANIRYDSIQSRVDVHVDPVIPQLTPLDVTNPAGSFASDDPWFWCLDPSQLGMAFNRQYGLVVDAATDDLPAGAGIWVRLLSRSPGLEFYRYRSSAGGKLWEPMFGTAGSTNLFVWNLAMFHPAVAAMPTNGTHTATFEAFAVDESTGQRLAEIEPAPFTLVWTIVPSAKPVLRLGGDLVLRWPATATNYVLQSAGALAVEGWVNVTNSAVIREGECRLLLTPLAPRQFFRLKRVP